MSDGPLVDDDLSRVVFLNEVEGGRSGEQVRQNMAQRFSLDAPALDRLFAGPPIVVKKNVDAETALQYKRAIEEAGAKCRIEPMPDTDDTDAHGYLERRTGERRQQRDRRSSVRPGAIKPDRRERRRDRRGGDGS